MALIFGIMVIGYLIGSQSASYLISRYIGKIDIRQHGSGNAGATNVFRNLGKGAGSMALLGDLLKGSLASFIGLKLGGSVDMAFLCGLWAVLGHCYPFTIGFKGGKGVATSAGVIAVVSPTIFLILLGCQILVILTTRYMSLASVVSALLLPVLGFLFHYEGLFIPYSIVFSLFVIYKHRENIKRLLNGTESKLQLKKK